MNEFHAMIEPRLLELKDKAGEYESEGEYIIELESIVHLFSFIIESIKEEKVLVEYQNSLDIIF